MYRILPLSLCLTLAWGCFAGFGGFGGHGGTSAPRRGAVWVLFLDGDPASAHAQPGMVLTHQKISDTEGGFTDKLHDGDFFGSSVTSLGDLDGDGVGDLAVGAIRDDDGGINRGAVWVLFLDTDGRVKSHQKISNTEGGFTGVLNDGDAFGHSLASLGDLDGDGVVDLAVGAPLDDDCREWSPEIFGAILGAAFLLGAIKLALKRHLQDLL